MQAAYPTTPFKLGPSLVQVEASAGLLDKQSESDHCSRLQHTANRFADGGHNLGLLLLDIRVETCGRVHIIRFNNLAIVTIGQLGTIGTKGGAMMQALVSTRLHAASTRAISPHELGSESNAKTEQPHRGSSDEDRSRQIPRDHSGQRQWRIEQRTAGSRLLRDRMWVTTATQGDRGRKGTFVR
ncbi:hypothetical protein BCR44DRAFT_194431 [Catenaria anguillulae PL171]|uniref:Uncharacterized protein n=1 Tax=Catenaria anguillulae PL171 TaxID=765915 RepID=A0A1Y2HPC0_9FUNG|nr:hypothetical protein BCR44DRAFT_194431 [Catenaria anguillulae PL171]